MRKCPMAVVQSGEDQAAETLRRLARSPRSRRDRARHDALAPYPREIARGPVAPSRRREITRLGFRSGALRRAIRMRSLLAPIRARRPRPYRYPRKTSVTDHRL